MRCDAPIIEPCVTHLAKSHSCNTKQSEQFLRTVAVQAFAFFIQVTLVHKVNVNTSIHRDPLMLFLVDSKDLDRKSVVSRRMKSFSSAGNNTCIVGDATIEPRVAFCTLCQPSTEGDRL